VRASVVAVSFAAALASAAAIASCKSGSDATLPANDASIDGAIDDGATAFDPIVIPPAPQRAGDVDRGYAALVDNGYVGCGIPYSAYAQVFPAAPPGKRIPGRNAANATIGYNVTRLTTAVGVAVFGPKCLTCHAAPLLGKVVVGLGDSTADFTVDYATQASAAQLLVTDPAERAELAKFLSRARALGPYTRTLTIGVTPSDNVAAVLFAHRDRKTLSWSDTPLLELPPAVVVPVDVPPWWRMKKKNAMFYTAAGRGDHARIMMTASTLCIDSVDEARAIDAYFNDVRAYVETLAPPAYPFPVDAALARAGQSVFAATCTRCHGSYGDAPSYPNLVLPLTQIGTDPILASGAAQFAAVYVQWFNESFYGETAHLDSLEGYYAPPLDGVWATAPYLHNGSIPTLAALMDSTTRPEFWTRTFDSSDYDPAALGWRFTALASGQDTESSASKRARIYDTSKLGYSRAGHTFGDALAPDDRRALLEYLKTL
jgi:cytochrome c5